MRPEPEDARGGSEGPGPGVAPQGLAGGCGVAKTGGKELKRVSSSGLRPAIREGANGEKISLERKARAGRSEGPTATMLWGSSAWAVPRHRGGGTPIQRRYHSAARGENSSRDCTTIVGEETARRGGTGRAAPLGAGYPPLRHDSARLLIFALFL